MAKEAANEFTVRFSKLKDTKGTYVYQEVNAQGVPVAAEEGAKIPSLYIRKTAFNGSGAPAKLSITVKAE